MIDGCRHDNNTEPAQLSLALCQVQVAAEWSTTEVDQLPDGAFLYIKPGGAKDSDGKTAPRQLRMFPFKDAAGKVDMDHLRNALSRLPQADITQQINDELKAKAEKLLADDPDGDGDSHTARTISRVISCQIVAQAGMVPDWVPMFPAPGSDGLLPCRDGRQFRLSDPNSFVARFNAEGHDVPFDLEHSSEIKAPQGDPAPAVGWVKKLELRGREVWGFVEWNDAGAKAVAAREYRYNSPAFNIDPKTKEITQLVSAALTNRPALVMPALARTQTGADTMHPKLTAALGLPETCSIEDVLGKIEELKKKQGGDGVTSAGPMNSQGGDGLSKAQAEIDSLKTQLAAAQTASPGLDKFVPRQDYDAMTARVASLEQVNAASIKAAHDKEVETEIASALRDGKITPATKDYHTKCCSTADGLSAFREFVKSAPVIVPQGTVINGKPAGSSGADELASIMSDPEMLTVAQKCGLSVDDIKKAYGSKSGAQVDLSGFTVRTNDGLHTAQK